MSTQSLTRHSIWSGEIILQTLAAEELGRITHCRSCRKPMAPPGRIGRPTIEVLGAENEMAKRTVRKFPDRKISETFFHFAAPLLHDLPGEAPERRAREGLQVSFTAWNAVIFADVLNDDRYLTEIRHLTADKPETALLVEQMIARKRALFAEDARLIGNWEVTRTEEEINLHADARDPHSLPRNPTDQH
jgi:hypothetical protein